ncbi:PAS domain-containing protein [Candidatus Uhrbacteria bacterium]|nr:PAS domain-containing protein [Candidatus Uhrbacteria bacterium]
MNAWDAEELHKSLFDNSPDGIMYCRMIFDARARPVDFTYLAVNKNFERLTGLKDVVGKNVTQLIPGIIASNPTLFEACGRVSSTGVSEDFEMHIESLERWFFVRAYSPNKNFFVAVFQNITEHKLIEKKAEDAKIAARNVFEDLQAEKQELAHVRAHVEAILASIGDGVITLDFSGRITRMNQAAQALLGLEGKDVIGKLLFDIFPIENEKGELVATIDRPMSVALSAGTSTTTSTTTTTTTTDEAWRRDLPRMKTIHGGFYYIRSDKTKFPVAITVTPVMLENTVVGAVEIFRDITKEQGIDKVKTEFVSLASHQLLGPITTIKWHAEMLLSGDAGPLNEQQRRFFEKIYESNQQMAGLVDALLNVARLELGTLTLKLEPTDTVSVISHVISEQKSEIERKNISLATHFADDLPTMLIDQKLLRMVVINILSNAIKYTPSKGTIDCAVWRVTKGECVDGRKMNVDSLVMKIADTGCGIPAHQHDKIFSKLFRADNARALNAVGTGLGLYVVKQIVDRFGGSVWFESQEQKGATFFVSIPLVMKNR